MKKGKMIVLIICVVVLIAVLIGVIIVQNNNTEANNESLNNNVVEENIELTELDKIYSNEVSKEFTDIRDLSEKYTLESAKQDNCFVIVGAKVYNDNLYEEFITKYNSKETAFIRVAQTTIEGNLILNDIFYDSDEDKIYLVNDSTRDEFSASEDRIIELRKYEYTGEWQYGGNLYWVVYNGEIEQNPTEEYKVDSHQLYAITIIN